MDMPMRQFGMRSFPPMGFTPPIVPPGSVKAPAQAAQPGGALPDFTGLLKGVEGAQKEEQVKGLLADFQTPKSNWADKLGILSGMLADLANGGGTEQTYAARGRWDGYVDDERKKFESAQAKKLQELAASGNDFALKIMDPLGARDFERAGDWRQQDLGREDANIARDENWRVKEFMNTIGQQDEDKRRFDETLGEDKRQFGMSYNQKNQEMLSAEAIAALKAGGDAATDEGALRREYLSQNKDFLDMQRSIGKIRSLDTSNAPGQMGLIFNVMKLYDPGSTVREGEFANAENARGVPASILNTYNKIVGGAFLTEDQITQFRGTADDLFGAAETDFERSFDTYRNQVAPGYGYDLDRTIPDLRQPKTPEFKSTSGAPVPPAAINSLVDSLSPAEMDEFDASFGRGSAAAILEQLGIDAPERPVPRAYDVVR